MTPLTAKLVNQLNVKNMLTRDLGATSVWSGSLPRSCEGFIKTPSVLVDETNKIRRRRDSL